MRKTIRSLPLTSLLLAGAAQATAADGPSIAWTDEYELQQQAWEAAALASLAGSAPEALPPADEEASMGEASMGEASMEEAAPLSLPPELSAQEALRQASAVPAPSTEPIHVKGCWYVASVGGQYRPGVGLRWLLRVSRLPSRGCVEQTAVIDSSYVGGPPFMMAVEHQGLALAFQSKQSPQGATYLRLYHVDPLSLGVVRQTLLGSTGRGTHAEEMSLEGNRLLVRGTKEGVIPGEVGSGTRFVATFPRFFTSQDAPSIFAYPAPAFAVPVQAPGTGSLSEEQWQLEQQGLQLEAAALEELRTALASAGAALPPPEAPASEPFEDDGLTELDALEYLRTHEPQRLRALADRPHKVRGCWYFIAGTIEGWPPLRTRYTLTRMPSRNCKGQTQTLGTTYGSGIQAVANQSQGIAVAFQQKWTLSGSGLRHVQVLAVDPKTMTINRSLVLGTYMGSTYMRSMYFDAHNLIVETYRYTATFPRFLTSLEPPQGVIFP